MKKLITKVPLLSKKHWNILMMALMSFAKENIQKTLHHFTVRVQRSGIDSSRMKDVNSLHNLPSA